MTVGVYPKQLSDGNPDGTKLGQSASDLIALHGASPAAQAAYTATISTTAPVSAAGSAIFGYLTSAQFIAHTAATNAILDCLIRKGLMASS